jgi:hypothetical protein
MFLKVISKVLARYDANVLITRKINKGSAFYAQIDELKNRYGNRIILGNTMPLADYYQCLWMSDIQVSTATHESPGIATLEAMYTRNCCILPCQSSYSEICGDCKEVLYPYSEEGLYQRLSYFIEQETERQEIAQRLYDMSLNFTPERVGSKICRVIDATTPYE